MAKIICALVFVVIFVYSVRTARILGLFHTPSYSHYILGEVLLKELAARGHEVVMVSSYPDQHPTKNFRVIELAGMKKMIDDLMLAIGISFIDDADMIALQKYYVLNSVGLLMVNYIYKHESIKKLLHSNETFDLIIMEIFFNEALYGFCHKFKAPCIGVGTMVNSMYTNRLTGNIAMASYIPDLNSPYSPNMTFLERLNNLITVILEEFTFYNFVLPQHNKIIHEYIPDAPDISDLIYNTSLVLMNTDPALSQPVPVLPNIKEVGGFHIRLRSNLPEDVQEFLDKNENVIYFSLGSNMQSKELPSEILDEILGAFKKWGKPILWKFEANLPEKLDNVKIVKWLPQPDVLAHKNVKAFITHCGKLSTLEGLYFGVPMVGLPIFCDQHSNAAQMKWAGYGIYTNIKTVNRYNLYASLVEITSNPKYEREAALRSKAMHKKPLKPLDEAIFWVEHILEFNGAPYLRNAGIDLPWYQFWMVDVVLFLIATVLGLNVLMIFVFVRICCKSKSKPVFKCKLQ